MKRILVLKVVCYSLRVLSTSASSSWGMSFYSPFFPSFLFPPTCLAWFSSSSIPYNNYDIMHSNYSVLLSELGWVELRFFLSFVTHLAGDCFLPPSILLLRVLPPTVTSSFHSPSMVIYACCYVTSWFDVTSSDDALMLSLFFSISRHPIVCSWRLALSLNTECFIPASRNLLPRSSLQ